MGSFINPIDNGTLGKGFCSAVLRGIEGVNGLYQPSMATPAGALQALFDPTNRDEVQFENLTTPNGAIKQVRVKRLPRGVITDAVDGVISCTPTSESGYTDDLVTLTEKASTSFEITLPELQAYCDDALRLDSGVTPSPTFMTITNMIMAKMNALRLLINQKVVALLDANRGINISYGNSNYQSVPMLVTATGAMVELGLQTIMSDLSFNEVYGRPIVIGHGIFDRFNTSIQAGCCNANGLNWEAMRENVGYLYYRDFEVGSSVGANNLLILRPGWTQFVFGNNTILSKTGNGRFATSNVGLIPDPLVPGLVYDIAIKEVDCQNGEFAPSWTVILYLNYNVSFVPETAFAVGDRLRTGAGISNGVFGYTATSI